MMKMAALKALGEIGDADTADAVAEVGISDPSPLVRGSAATALRLFNDSRSVDVLISILAPDLGTSAYTQRWAASQLAALDALEGTSSIERAAAQSSMLHAWRLRRIASRLRHRVER
jgi:HEAT repeat protein